MKVSKFFYYLESCCSLFRIINTRSYINVILGKKILILNNGLIFKYESLLDLLIIKETIVDDVYKLSDLKKAKNIIDIGAGFGDFSLFAAQKFPDSKVYAFEPNSLLYTRMKKNIKLNNIKNINLKNIALTDKIGKMNLFLPNELTHGSSIKINFEENLKKILVNTDKLDNYIKTEIDLLKMDCEGSEWNIIKNLKINTFIKIKNISLEYHSYLIPNVEKLINSKLTEVGLLCKIKQDRYEKNMGYIYAKRIKNV